MRAPALPAVRSLLLVAAVAGAVLATGCTRQEVAPPPVPVAAWTAEDGSAVATALVDASLKTPWANSFRERSGRIPQVLVGDIRDRSEVQVDTSAFAKTLGQALLASGKVGPAGEKPDFTLTGVISPSTQKIASGKVVAVDLTLSDAAGTIAWKDGMEYTVPERLPPAQPAAK